MFEGRVECARCKRPEVACYCAHLPSLPTQTRVLVLSHPREYENPIGTAHMASLCLPNSVVAVGVELENDPIVRAELAAQPCVVLYPGPDAKDLAVEPPTQPCTLIVVDGTWSHARALVRKNPFLRSLPSYAFAPSKPSEYRIRKEPKAEYVSTLEALMHALSLIEGDGARFEALLAPFRAMVDVQVRFAESSSGGRHRQRRRRETDVTPRLPGELTTGELVCVMGEANAWPYDRDKKTAPHPHELVHWLALRLSNDERFETVLAPREPLSRSPMIHAGLAESDVRGGLTLSAFAEAWASFVRPGDVLCTWGPYPMELFAREFGTPTLPVLDLRKITGDYLKERPGRLDARLKQLGLTWHALGKGRGGERLGMVTAVARWLAELARSSQGARGFTPTGDSLGQESPSCDEPVSLGWEQ